MADFQIRRVAVDGAVYSDRLRLAVGRALIGVMVGELYAATAGIGFMITVAGATFQTDKVFVGVLIFAISGMALPRSSTDMNIGSTSGVPKSALNKRDPTSTRL